jgi:plasmid stabilization system protein ParE
MDSFEVIISPKALSQLNDYIQYTLLNPQAAKSVWEDAIGTTERLESIAGSLRYCANSKLRKLGYKPIFFQHHDYVMLFRIEGNTAFVDAIFHQLQDYEKNFSQEL